MIRNVRNRSEEESNGWIGRKRNEGSRIAEAWIEKDTPDRSDLKGIGLHCLGQAGLQRIRKNRVEEDRRARAGLIRTVRDRKPEKGNEWKRLDGSG